MCVVLNHLDACEWETINMFVLTLNAVCLRVFIPLASPMGTVVCAKACVTRNTHKERQPLILLISHLHEPLSCICLYQRQRSGLISHDPQLFTRGV